MKLLGYLIFVCISTHIFSMQPPQADINAQDSYGYTLLMRASLYGELQEAEKLIKVGAKLDMQNLEGETALMLATSFRPNAGIAELLISKGADLHLRAWNGRTALHYAAARSLTLTQKLLVIGADPCIKDNRGATPKDRAKWYLDEQKEGKLLFGNTQVNDDQDRLESTIALLEQAEKLRT